MSSPALGALQVAALLVSASYGIGFLFGSGEYALQYGMAGAVYGVASGLGMIALAAFAGRLWLGGRAVWDLLGERSGERVRRSVALLSMVWMSGVLAAQIHGVVAVVQLLGGGAVVANAVAITLIAAASRFELRTASLVFATCLAASAGVLLYALVHNGGAGLYVGSLPAFAQALPSLGVVRACTVAISVGLLVCAGADYHQFVLAAREPRAAVCGCLLAGACLLLLAFLPPAVVLSAIGQPSWPGVTDARQVMPQVLALAAKDLVPVAGPLMLGVLGLAALGSGAAVVRAMVSALQAAVPRSAATPSLVPTTAAMGPAALLAAAGLPIVDTMVSVNGVYIASVGVGLFAMLRGRDEDPVVQTRSMAAGFIGAVLAFVPVWAGGPLPGTETIALLLGLSSSALMRLALKARWGKSKLSRMPRL